VGSIATPELVGLSVGSSGDGFAFLCYDGEAGEEGS
jgi:hypothetical protein